MSDSEAISTDSTNGHSIILLFMASSMPKDLKLKKKVPITSNFSAKNENIKLDEIASKITKLSTEVLVTIFSHLSREDLLHVEAVCSRWLCIVRWHVWPLEEKASFCGKDSPKFIRHFLTQRGHFLRELHLDGIEHTSVIESMMALDLVPNLRKLSITNSMEDKKDAISGIIEKHYFGKI